MEKRWKYKTLAKKDAIDQLANAINVDTILATLLTQRDIKTFEDAKTFFRPQLSAVHNPWEMKNMKKAVDRIAKATLDNEKILVYGDYDVDGTTATSMVYSFLKEDLKYTHVGYYIPDRYAEGYGISKQGIDFASVNDYKLVIALDCGIKAIEKINYAKRKGVDFIICDHHLPGAGLPDAQAILNPKQADCPYPYKELSGCGVGFKLLQALASHFLLPENAVFRLLDLVAISICSDIVPITGENRILCWHGLKKLNKSALPGLQCIMQSTGKELPFSVEDVVFSIGPRINAAGRLEHGKQVVEILTATHATEPLKQTVANLGQTNQQRGEIDQAITQEALDLIANDVNFDSKKSTVVYQPHWHKGVVGIVASRLVETHFRPTIVLTQSNGKISGSARSVTGFNVYKAIDKCAHLLSNYGGHMYAAGMTLKNNDVTAFASAFDKAVSISITEEQLQPKIWIDAEIKPTTINKKFFGVLQQMAPFGPQNMQPVFVMKNVKIGNYPKRLKETHVKFKAKLDEKNEVDCIGFNLGDKFLLLQPDSRMDLVFTIGTNVFNGSTSLQFNIKDFKPTEV